MTTKLTYVGQWFLMPVCLNGIATLPDHQLSTQTFEVSVHVLRTTLNIDTLFKRESRTLKVRKNIKYETPTLASRYFVASL